MHLGKANVQNINFVQYVCVTNMQGERGGTRVGEAGGNIDNYIMYYAPKRGIFILKKHLIIIIN